jgi:hypothetical protein
MSLGKNKFDENAWTHENEEKSKKFNSANQHKEERKEQTVMKSPGQ